MDLKTSVAPGRYARVAVSMGDGAGLCTVFGNKVTSCLKEFKVGPLPLVPSTTKVIQRNIASNMKDDKSFSRDVFDVPFDARFADSKEEDQIGVLLEKNCVALHDIFLIELGSSCKSDYTNDDGLITWSNTGPFGSLHDMTMWLAFDFNALYANPVGVQFTQRMMGSDPSTYFTLQIVFNGQAYITPTNSLTNLPLAGEMSAVDQFIKAYTTGWYDYTAKPPTLPLKKIAINGVSLLQFIKHKGEGGLGWSELKKGQGDHDELSLPNSNILNPQAMLPGGQRFVQEGGHIEYLGWSFHITHDIHTGIKIMDIRYRKERIAWEIGLAEAMASYSGINDVVQASTLYGDTAWGLGSCPAMLVLGIDCPGNAKLMDITFLESDGSPTTKKDAMCIFEQTMQGPVRRHYDRNSDGFNFYGGAPNHALVIRAFYPVYNYDYMIDHVFYHNGAFEIRGATSGYLQSTFYSEAFKDEKARFGIQVHENVMGNQHDHFLNFKVDFDLLGESNSVMTDKIEILKCDDAKDCVPQDIHGKPYASQLFKDASDYKTKHVKREHLEVETGLSLTPGIPTMIHVSNEAEQNKWGYDRSYKMKINGVAQNIIADTKMHKAYSFSRHTVMATRYHEEEEHVTTIYDQQDTTGTMFASIKGGDALPLIDMDQMINGEKIRNADIVIWANVGVHHIPHAEDIPVTHMIGNAVQISFIPTNMYDIDQSMDLGNVVYMDKKLGKDSKMEKYDLLDKNEDLCAVHAFKLGENLIAENLEGYPWE